MSKQLVRVKDHQYLYRRGDTLWFRRAVPVAARAAFEGRREVQISLRTGKLSEARHRLHAGIVDFEARLSRATGCVAPFVASVVSSPREPSKEEIEEVVRGWLRRRTSEIHVPTFSTPAEMSDGERRLTEIASYIDEIARGIGIGSTGPSLATQWIAESLISAAGWQIDMTSERGRHLLRMVGRGQIEASAWQAQEMRGDPRSIRDARFSPHEYQADIERRAQRVHQKAVSIIGLFNGYVEEARPAAATIKAWRRQVQAFVTFVGHDDAARIAVSDVVAWKKQLLTLPNAKGNVLSARTVRDTYLSALKTTFRWATLNGEIAANPAREVTVAGRKRVVTRERGLTDSEALKILSATLDAPPARLTPERVRARRWVPWLCAYTGARVNEITQLRYEDVYQVRGIWTILITPEAGSTKSGQARAMALHPHVVDQGFGDIVGNRTGPIFYDPKRHRGGLEGNPQSKKTGEHLQKWVRTEVGVDDPDVQPNHGWRHRFKTQARLANMDPEVRDVIQGHAGRTESEGYGETYPEVTLRELKKLPRYPVKGL